jgi:hypothetical protein
MHSSQVHDIDFSELCAFSPNRAGARPSVKLVHGSKQRGFVKWFRFHANFFPVLIAPENTLFFSAPSQLN